MDWDTFWAIEMAATAAGIGWVVGVAVTAALIKLVTWIFGGEDD